MKTQGLTAKRVVLLACLGVTVAIALEYYTTRTDPRERQRREVEELEANYRTEARKWEQSTKAELASDQDIAAKIAGYNGFIAEVSKGYDALRSTAEQVAQGADALGQEPPKVRQFPTGLDIREVRFRLISEKPTSIRPNPNDLVQRYVADVQIAFELVMNRDDRNAVQPVTQTLIATATPERKWTFPAIAQVKQQILSIITTSKEEAKGFLEPQYRLDADTLILRMKELTAEAEKRALERKLQQPTPR